MPQTESVADNAGPNVRSVERIAAILTAFTAARPMLTLSEVARTAALDKNTTRRLLIALSRTGLVRRDEAEGTYGLDIAMLKLQPAVVGPRALRETGIEEFLDFVRSIAHADRHDQHSTAREQRQHQRQDAPADGVHCPSAPRSTT